MNDVDEIYPDITRDEAGLRKPWVESALARLPRTGEPQLRLLARVHDRLAEPGRYLREHGEDMREIGEWRWPAP